MATDENLFGESDEVTSQDLMASEPLAPMTFPAGAAAAPAARSGGRQRSTWNDPRPVDMSQFQTIPQFYASAEYRGADFAGKKELERAYKARWLNESVGKSLNVPKWYMDDAIKDFDSRAAKDERKNDSWFDTDVVDRLAVGLAQGVGGVARVAGELFDSDAARALADKAAADVEKIKRENYSATTRYAQDAERVADEKLAAEYGGKENIPWYRTLGQEWRNFWSQPVGKIMEAVGTSIPALAASAGGALLGGPIGSVAAATAVSSALTSGDAGSGAYDDVMAMKPEQLANLPAFKDMLARTGGDAQEAQRLLASQASLEAGAYGAIIGAVSGGVSAAGGALAIVRKKITGQALNAAETKVVRTAEEGIFKKYALPVGVEAASESAEEGSTQIAQNAAKQTIDPSQSLTEDALKAATAGALAGGGMAGGLHLLPGRTEGASNQNGENDAGSQPPQPAPSGDAASNNQAEAIDAAQSADDGPAAPGGAVDGAGADDVDNAGLPVGNDTGAAPQPAAAQSEPAVAPAVQTQEPEIPAQSAPESLDPPLEVVSAVQAEPAALDVPPEVVESLTPAPPPIDVPQSIVDIAKAAKTRAAEFDAAMQADPNLLGKLRNTLFDSVVGRPLGPSAGKLREAIDVAEEALTPTQIADIFAGNLTNVLQGLATNGHAQMAAVASAMLPISREIKVDFRPLGDRIAGLHIAYPKASDKKHGRIVLNSKGFISVGTLLHEVAHAYTAYSFDNAITPKQKKAKLELEETFQLAKKSLSHLKSNSVLWNQLEYGLSNDIHEFVAEAFSNPVLQAHLATVKTVGDASLLTKFARLVAKLFGVDNAFARTLILTDRVVNAKQNSQTTSPASSTAGQIKPSETTGSSANQGTASGRRVNTRKANGRSGSDNRGVSTPDQTAGASARETGTAAGTGNPAVEGPPSRSVADAVAKLPDADRVAIEVAGGMADMSGADFAQLLVDAAEKHGAEEVLGIFDEDDALGSAVRSLPFKQPIQTALNNATNQIGKLDDYEKLNKFWDTGELPKANKYAGWSDRYIEKFIDSAQPFAKMLRVAGAVLDNPIWQAFKLASSKYEHQKVALNRSIKTLNKALTKLAKRAGLDPQEFFMKADSYTLAKYVATGANDELLHKHQQAIAKFQAEIAAAMKQLNAATNPVKIADIQKQIDNLQLREAKHQSWVSRYDTVNNVIRKPAGTLLSDGSPDPAARLESDKFVGGLTQAEAQAILDKPSAAAIREELESAQQAIVGLQKQWAQHAVNEGLFGQDEIAEWSANPNYVPTTGDPRADDDTDEAYQTGGLVSRDYARMGRSSLADGGFMAVIQQASGLARRIGYRDFYNLLAETGRKANPYGIVTMPTSRPSQGYAFATKRFDQDAEGNTVTHYEKVWFEDQAAAASIIGKNRKELDGPIMRGLTNYTSLFGRAVTQFTLAFGPVNYVRDTGEKAYSLLATTPGINKAKFLAAVARHFFSIENLRAALAFSRGQPMSNAAGQALDQLAANGGLNTRTGSLSRDVERIVKEMKRTDGWREVADSVGEAVHHYNNMFETAASLAVYRALGEATDGMPLDQRAFRVLNTMNFGQSGTYSPMLKAFYLFYNPAAQGALNAARGVMALKTGQGRAALIGAAIGYAFLYAMARAIGGDDDDDGTGNRLDSLADASLSRNIPIFLGDDFVVKLPVPFGLQTAVWSSVVAAGRLLSGRYDPGEAVAFSLQGAAEQVAPFPLSRVDITEHPGFWAAKSLTPQWGQVLLNLAADRNDFGGKLTAEFMQRDKPTSTQGRAATPDFYKSTAKEIFKLTGVDMAPEHLQEAMKMLAIGPLGAGVEGFLKDEERSGVPTWLSTAQGLTGSNRLVSQDTKEVDRTYYTRLSKVYDLYKKAYFDSPREKVNNRYEPLTDWLERTNLSGAEQTLITKTEQVDRELKAARKRGATISEQRAIMSRYLGATRDLK